MEQQPGQPCIICGQVKEEGIVIVSHFICEDCESEMVHTEAEDAKYRFYWTDEEDWITEERLSRTQVWNEDGVKRAGGGYVSRWLHKKASI